MLLTFCDVITDAMPTKQERAPEYVAAAAAVAAAAFSILHWSPTAVAFDNNILSSSASGKEGLAIGALCISPTMWHIIINMAISCNLCYTCNDFG